MEPGESWRMAGEIAWPINGGMSEDWPHDGMTAFFTFLFSFAKFTPICGYPEMVLGLWRERELCSGAQLERWAIS